MFLVRSSLINPPLTCAMHAALSSYNTVGLLLIEGEIYPYKNVSRLFLYTLIDG